MKSGYLSQFFKCVAAWALGAAITDPAVSYLHPREQGFST
jgi:hypothetical protein